METRRRTAAVVGALVLMSVPAFALAGERPENQGTARAPEKAAPAPAPGAKAPTKAKAYGKYCADQSRKHVKGEKGTAFSRCVRAMAKLASGATDSPRTACKDLPRKRADGEARSAFSRCVADGAKLLRDLA